MNDFTKQVQDFFVAEDPSLIGRLDQAVYTVSELNLWPDYVHSVSTEQAIMCWKIVEKMRIAEFPKDLTL